MSKAKVVCSPLTDYFKLSSKQYPISEKEKEEISRMPYSYVVGSLMCTIVCIR